MSSREPILAALLALATACGNVAASREVECAAQPIEVLPNGGFDASTPPWVQTPVTPALLCGMPTITPDSAPSAGCLGGFDGMTQTLTQTVPLPEGASSVTLTGKICISTADTTTAEHDLLQFDLLDGGNVIAAIGKKTNRDGVAACQFETLELTAPVTGDPESATFRIRTTLDTSMTTTFYIDSLSLTVGCAK